MRNTWDKAQIWKQVLRALGQEVDFGVLNLVQDATYLDSLEQGIAVIGCRSAIWEQMLKRRRVDVLLERILGEMCQTPVTVLFANGRPRIFEKKPGIGGCDAPPETELAALHAKYGDIMGIVDGHPVFKQANKSILHGGFGYHAKVLTAYCKDYGVMAVLTGLREVASDPSIERPRAYFSDELKKGRWGHKLVITPSLTGPAMVV